ncbi:hypothetical protein [Methylobacterium sp. J-068]|uniref:hypothetical protein n=1 Tax=Methylobacterium sp. J-068 TaxID=2836649 RepID=UPI001FB9A0C3|nr:hypothetical protein [Methylobacterium sp. J-068]MCJ2034596.1 hypothetical protein [Methylobacterium sp. J-068]
MTMTDEMVALAEVCLEANEIVQAHGTPEMKSLLHLLLLEIGQEIARRQAETKTKLDDS